MNKNLISQIYESYFPSLKVKYSSIFNYLLTVNLSFFDAIIIFGFFILPILGSFREFTNLKFIITIILMFIIFIIYSLTFKSKFPELFLIFFVSIVFVLIYFKEFFYFNYFLIIFTILFLFRVLNYFIFYKKLKLLVNNISISTPDRVFGFSDPILLKNIKYFQIKNDTIFDVYFYNSKKKVKKYSCDYLDTSQIIFFKKILIESGITENS